MSQAIAGRPAWDSDDGLGLWACDSGWPKLRRDEFPTLPAEEEVVTLNVFHPENIFILSSIHQRLS